MSWLPLNTFIFRIDHALIVNFLMPATSHAA
jgi:hypothetical protein